MITLTDWERLAEVYDRAETDYSAEVKNAYREFNRECLDQFSKIPVKVEFTKRNPYKTSRAMFEDIEKRGRLKIFTGGAMHPLLTHAENCIFRAVHDFYGHYLARSGFSPGGEFRAWVNHSRMFSDVAKKVLHTETIGQVAYFFYSRENRGKGNKEKSFAKQKACILDFNFNALLRGEV